MIKLLLDLAKKHTWLFETDDGTFDLFSRSGDLCHGSKGNFSEVNPAGDLQKRGCCWIHLRAHSCACGVSVSIQRGARCRIEMVTDCSGLSDIS